MLPLISVSLEARQIDVVAGWNKPPYIVTSDNSGFEIELAKKILARLGHSINPIYVPFGRTVRQLKSGRADIVLTVNLSHEISAEYLTDEYVTYQNSAISLASRQLDLHSVDDLKNYTVLAFQTARRVLGADFANATGEHRGYLEIADQGRQVRMLLLGSVDIAVMDRNIFSWLRSQLPPAQQKDVRIHNLFKQTSYRAAIADKALREGFNRELKAMMEDGQYQMLADKYRLAITPASGDYSNKASSIFPGAAARNNEHVSANMLIRQQRSY